MTVAEAKASLQEKISAFRSDPATALVADLHSGQFLLLDKAITDASDLEGMRTAVEAFEASLDSSVLSQSSKEKYAKPFCRQLGKVIGHHSKSHAHFDDDSLVEKVLEAQSASLSINEHLQDLAAWADKREQFQYGKTDSTGEVSLHTVSAGQLRTFCRTMRLGTVEGKQWYLTHHASPVCEFIRQYIVDPNCMRFFDSGDRAAKETIDLCLAQFSHAHAGAYSCLKKAVEIKQNTPAPTWRQRAARLLRRKSSGMPSTGEGVVHSFDQKKS